MNENKNIKPIHPILKQFIHSFWILRGNATGIPYLLPPEPYFNCILSFKSNTNSLNTDGSHSPISGSFLCGIRKRAFSVLADGAIDYLGIQFYCHGLRPFLDFHCKELTNSFVEVDSIQGQLKEIIKPIINESLSDEKRVELLEDGLLSILVKRQYLPSKALLNTLRVIKKTEGQISIENLSSQTGFSCRQLNREFDRFIGVSPKYFSRIIRFNRLLEELKSSKLSNGFAALAYDCGYFDQAHMIHECIQFSGLSPTELVRMIKNPRYSV